MEGGEAERGSEPLILPLCFCRPSPESPRAIKSQRTMEPLASLGDYPFYQHRALGQAQCLANFPKAWPDQRCVSNILPTLNEQEATKSRRSLNHSPQCVACVGKMFIQCSYLFGAPPCDSRLTNKATALRRAIRLYTLLITGKSAPPTLFWHLLAIDQHGLIVREKVAHDAILIFASNGLSTDHPIFGQGTHYPQCTMLACRESP